jgi:hypothetical protein
VFEHHARFGRSVNLESEHPRLHGCIVIEVDIAGMEPNYNTISEQPGKLGSPPHVIEMTVRMENHGRFEAALANPFDNPRGLLAGIDHHELAGFDVTEEYAVGLNRSHRKNFKEKCTH